MTGAYRPICDGIGSEIRWAEDDEPDESFSFKNFRDAKRALLQWLDYEVAAIRDTQAVIRATRREDIAR